MLLALKSKYLHNSFIFICSRQFGEKGFRPQLLNEVYQKALEHKNLPVAKILKSKRFDTPAVRRATIEDSKTSERQKRPRILIPKKGKEDH